jgi:uncharacterized protein YbjT (DUF2867 family)
MLAAQLAWLVPNIMSALLIRSPAPNPRVRNPCMAGGAPILVLGATGKVGLCVCRQLSESGYSVRALARDPTSPTAATLAVMPGVDVMQGNILEKKSLTTAVAGCSAVISVSGASRKSSLEDLMGIPPPILRTDMAFESSHPQQVNYLGVANTIEAMQAAGVRKIVRLTGLSCSFSAFNPFVLLIGCGLLSMSTAWHARSENLLRDSQLDYTILRPGGLSDDARGSNTLVACSETLPIAQGRIGRSDLAALAIEAACGTNGKRATVACGWAKDREDIGRYTVNSWAPLLAAIPPDAGPLPLQPYRLAVGLLLGGGLLATLLACEQILAKVFLG